VRSCWVENGALMGLPPSAVARSPAQMKLLLSCLYGLTLFPCLQQVIRGVQHTTSGCCCGCLQSTLPSLSIQEAQLHKRYVPQHVNAAMAALLGCYCLVVSGNVRLGLPLPPCCICIVTRCSIRYASGRQATTDLTCINKYDA
jgi:hypothetical protein